MILSSRPTDRRQLIEEAAGVTKYKARRRAAELKLEAAQQNLTRIDDIVFEVEKQRGTLKRQAGEGAPLPEAARRAAALGEGAVRPQVSAAGRDDRIGARAAGRRARARSRRPRRECREVESDLGRAAHRAGRGRVARDRRARGGARARARDQPPAAADRVRPRAGPDALGRARRRSSSGARHARRAPRAGARWRSRRAAAPAAQATGRARSRGRGAGGRVRGVRDRRTAKSKGSRPTSRRRAAKCFRPSTRATALRHALEQRRGRRATASPRRCRSWRSKPRTCASSSNRLETDRSSAADGLRRAHEAIEATRIARSARESELASARIEHEWRARSVRRASTSWRVWTRG